MIDYTRDEVECMAVAAGHEFEWLRCSWWDDDADTIRDEDVLHVDDGPWEPWEDKAQCLDLMVDAKIAVGWFSDDGGCVAFHETNESAEYYDPEDTAEAICRAAIEKGRAMRGMLLSGRSQQVADRGMGRKRATKSEY